MRARHQRHHLPAGVLLLGLLSGLFLGLLSGCELFPGDDLRPAGHAAALAIRDDVVGWQEWGTQAHTAPFLEKGYRTSIYLEEAASSSRAEHHEKIRAALIGLLSSHDAVDLFILVHGNAYARVVEEIDPDLRSRLRLVYSTGAGEIRQAARWRALGAKAFVGHPGSNVAPLFYAHFLPRWLGGAKLEDAVRSANEDTRGEMLSSPFRAAMTVGGWLGSPFDAESLWAGTEARWDGEGAISTAD